MKINFGVVSFSFNGKKKGRQYDGGPLPTVIYYRTQRMAIARIYFFLSSVPG